MSIDTSRTIEIESSPKKLALLALVSVVFVVIGVLMVRGVIDGPVPDPFIAFIGWCGIVFFGLCGAVILWRLATQRGPVVTIAPQGIRDVRIADDFIPWGSVREISTWTFQKQSAMVLAVDPAAERGFVLTRMARMTRDMNRSLGADGLCVTASGIKIDYDTLLATSMAYWEAHRAPT